MAPRLALSFHLILAAIGICLGYQWPLLALATPLLVFSPLSSAPPNPKVVHPRLVAELGLSFSIGLCVALAVAGWSAARASLDPTPQGFALALGATLFLAGVGHGLARWFGKPGDSAPLLGLACLSTMVLVGQLPQWSWARLTPLAGQVDPRTSLALLGILMVTPAALVLGWHLRQTERPRWILASCLGLVFGCVAGSASWSWGITFALAAGLTAALRRGRARRRLAGVVVAGAALTALLAPFHWNEAHLLEGRATHLREPSAPARLAEFRLGNVARGAQWGGGGAVLALEDGRGDLSLSLDGLLVQPQGRGAEAERMAGHLGMVLATGAEHAMVIGDEMGLVTGSLVAHPLDRISVAVPNTPAFRLHQNLSETFSATMGHPSVHLSRGTGEAILRQRHPVDLVIEVSRTPWHDAYGGLPSSSRLSRRARALSPGGAYLLVLSTNWLAEGQFYSLLSGFEAAFAEAWIFLPPQGADQILIAGWPRPPALEFDTLLEVSQTSAEALGEIGIRSALDLADRALVGPAGIHAMARPEEATSMGLPETLFGAPTVLLPALRDHLVSAAGLFPEISEEVAQVLAERAETHRVFLRLLHEAGKGDMRQVFEASRALMEQEGGSRALDPVIEPYLERARRALAQGRQEGGMSNAWNEAQRELAAAQLLHPNSPAVLSLLGEALLEQGNLDRAQDHFTRALETDPGRAEALLGLARLALARGDRRGAENHLRRAVERNPRNWLPVYDLGVFLEEAGLLPEAEERLRLAAELAGTQEAAPHTALARLYLGQSQATRALVEATLAARLSPTGMNYYLQGRAYYDVDQLSSAAAAFQEAVLLDSSLWQARGGLGLVFARQGEFERCVQSFRQVLEASPGNPAAAQNLASCEAEVEGAG